LKVGRKVPGYSLEKFGTEIAYLYLVEERKEESSSVTFLKDD